MGGGKRKKEMEKVLVIDEGKRNCKQEKVMGAGKRKKENGKVIGD